MDDKRSATVRDLESLLETPPRETYRGYDLPLSCYRFQAMIGNAGITVREMAAKFGVEERSVRRWQAGSNPRTHDVHKWVVDRYLFVIGEAKRTLDTHPEVIVGWEPAVRLAMAMVEANGGQVRVDWDCAGVQTVVCGDTLVAPATYPDDTQDELCCMITTAGHIEMVRLGDIAIEDATYYAGVSPDGEELYKHGRLRQYEPVNWTHARMPGEAR